MSTEIIENQLQEFKRIIEKDKIFFSNDFLFMFTKLAFGIKTDTDVQKNSTMVIKEYKQFINTIVDLEKKQNIKIINLSTEEHKILNIVLKCVNLKSKLIDGTDMVDAFKTVVQSDPELNTIDKESLVSKYTNQYMIDASELNIIERKLHGRKSMLSSIKNRILLNEFMINGHKECGSIEKYREDLDELLKKCISEIDLTEVDKSSILCMTEQRPRDFLDTQKYFYKIPTKYKLFDTLFNGGFENGRVYLFGGISGGGKSLVLVNFAYLCKKTLDELAEKEKEESEKDSAILYLTLENSCEETRMRFMSAGTGVSKQQIGELFNRGDIDEIDSSYETLFGNKSTELFIVWASPQTMDSISIMTLINNLEKNHNKKIKICFIDYADKLKCAATSSSKEEWIVLGHVMDELKALAITLNIPVVSVTQVNRDSYNNGDNMLSGKNISGSHRKKENVDVLVMFDFASRATTVISDDSAETSLDAFIEKQVSTVSNFSPIWGFVDKNRDGPSNIKFKAYIDYPRYRFIDNTDRMLEVFGEPTLLSPVDSICSINSFI